MSRDAFYRALEGIHNLYFNDMRFGQFMNYFLGYVKNDKNLDIHYLTDTELMDLLNDYIAKDKKQ